MHGYVFDEEDARIARDLWPLAMSGIAAYRITIMREAGSGRYIGLTLDGERVCDGQNTWPKAERTKQPWIRGYVGGRSPTTGYSDEP